MKDVAEEQAAAKSKRVNRFLPYYAVFQADVHQTLRSWVYRTWVLLSLLVAFGYLLYRFGAYREASIIVPASHLMSELLQWSLLGSVTLIIVLTAGSISAEMGTLADSVLSRGISRYQYFLGKWHARLITVLGTFFFVGLLVLAGSVLLLRDDNVSLTGSLLALAVVSALLGVVISCGVTISAMTHSTVLGIAVVWLALYGSGFLLSQLPASYPSPDRALKNLPNILKGLYDVEAITRLIVFSTVVSLVVALIGMVSFARRDV
jgi:ABC-2 type transport system permease protein